MLHHPSRRRRALALGVCAAAVAGLSLSQPASAAQQRHALRAARPEWTGHARSLGSTKASDDLHFGVLLGMRNSAQLDPLIQRLADPGSSQYGHWLTHAQFVSRFAPAARDVSAVRSWLTSQGLHVDRSLTDGLYLEVHGRTSDVERAFDTSMHDYRLDGRRVHTNTGALSIAASTPPAVVHAISGVIGLDQGSDLKKPADTVLPGPPPGSRYGVQPCSAYYGQEYATDKPKAYGATQPYAVCGYVPRQYQGAYGETPLLRHGISGRGVTVAITDAYASPTMLSDAQTYNARRGQPLFTRGQYREIRPSSYNVYDPADAQGWYGEETLDVEAVHALAPGAKIVYVSASDDEDGLNNAWAEAIDDHVADIVTNSWSFGSDDVDSVTAAFFDTYAAEAALTGITDNFSTGDDGDLTVGGTKPADLDVGFPADNPYVTGVGGTSVGIGSHNQWLGEYGWSNSYSTLTGGAWSPNPPGTYSSGGGGGTSTLYPEPSYQKNVVPTKLADANGKTPMRVIPDISMPGDPNTGMLIGETQVFPNGTYYDEYRIGGTSLSSPLLAGVIAVADQVAGRSLGFVNPLYYKLAGTRALHDLSKPTSPLAQVRTNYTNGVDASGGYTYILQTVDGPGGTLADTPGYDNETGVGSPGGTTFFHALAALGKGSSHH